jgi:hypothetical protein
MQFRPPPPPQVKEPEPSATVVSSDRDCPLDTARDRCLWHVGGTAGEHEDARTWQRRLPAEPEGEDRPAGPLRRWPAANAARRPVGVSTD